MTKINKRRKPIWGNVSRISDNKKSFIKVLADPNIIEVYLNR